LRPFLWMICILFLISGCSVADGEETIKKPVTGEGDVMIGTSVNVETKPDQAVFHMTVTNQSNKEKELLFNSGQKFELIITNQSGEKVYRFSEGKMFTQALEMVRLKVGESKTWDTSWDYKKNGKRVPSGKYVAVITIVASQIDGKKIKKDQLQATTDVIVPDENTAFRNVKVEGQSGKYKVTGEARVFEGSFHYTVDDGHNYIIDEQVAHVKQGAPEWSPFELNLSIQSEKWPENGTLTLHLYERSEKDGNVIHSYDVALEQFGR
jgi:Intracellular proteinase inhibitor/Immunoglobulin-like domain of bacterial spore germination